MSELLPSTQATSLQRALLDYLATTFALADADAQQALRSFLEHQSDGIFKGPYLRTRLPFAPAAEGWESLLDVLPAGFVPYGHQAAAFARLSGRNGRPQPTLVTTGTGSGKTEAFLYPILDQVLRARNEGSTGLTALILYPMNALANDQASRLARLIAARPTDGSVNPYAGITAALYTGEDGPKRTKVSPDGLITDRAIIRSGAPDILLTNYKMLDHLLLRADDAALWQRSAESLRYIVLDEFHTYDGAQGTDVAMLLRRLGLTLKHHWPARGSASDRHSDADWERPLGQATPVGTSATLGDGHDNTAMIGFASEVFGEPFDAECVITETRVPWDAWAARAALPTGFSPAALSSTLVHDIVTALDGTHDGDALTRTLLGSLIVNDDAIQQGTTPDSWAATASADDLLRCAQALPLMASLIERTSQALALDDLVSALLPVDARGLAPDEGQQLVSLLVAALSHLRAALGRNAASIEVHLWIRELTRIDRRASSAPAYRWGDDGSIAPRAADLNDVEGAFPAIYCRHCGRSGWGVELATTGTQLSSTDRDIRRNHLAKTGRFRALIHAPSEAQRAHEGDSVDGLAWLNTQTRELSVELPDTADAAYRDGRVLPTLTLLGKDADDDSRNDTCPSCLQRDGIRFLGSAIATLLSVTLTSLFGSADLDAAEKKALVFTDSVQDAAHRAGFVAARSHTFTLRAAIRDGLSDADGGLDLTDLARRMLARAGDDPFRRYRLLPTSFLRDEAMRPFWTLDRQSQVPRPVARSVRERLQFDLSIEFGLGSQYGRTLEATGSVAAQVDIGTPARIAAIAAQVVRSDDTQTLDGHLEDLAGPSGEHVRISWVRGVVEHMRIQGAANHPWLDQYLRSDGNRWRLTGGRRRGMPSFPSGRAHPAFPRVGGKRMRDPLLDPVTDPQSWYARWTARTLGVSPTHGASLARRLLERLAKESLLRSVNTDSGGTVYGIDLDKIIVTATSDADLSSTHHLLECTVCHTPVPGTIEATEQRDGAPCLYVRCPGRLTRARMDPANFYRNLYASSDMRRIVAREHTSLLESKQRLAYEEGFKRGSHNPDAPNTLVATPTLEMGIDIGDLSAVFLASLPRTVASYLQRIGRAGRLTGNALTLAYVTGRGEFLPRLSDPPSLINGTVRPPAIYLSAEEILQRQYLAHLVDRFARDTVDAHHPHTARAALERTEPGTFLGDLIDEAEARAADHLATFLACFGTGTGSDLRDPSVAALRAWATPGDAPRSSGLAASVFTASTRWIAQRELLEHRQASIQKALPDLKQAAEVPAASDDDKRSLQTAEAALRLTQAQLADITGEYWIAALEQFGLLPNYTLLGDAATLDVAISWFDPDTSSYEHESTGVQRPVSQALREFAPGATFYAKGLEITVDAVDLGTDADGIREIAFCPECGYAVDTGETGRPRGTGACPRCGSAGLQDVGQRLAVVELKRSSAAIRRDEALIDDRRDDRQRAPFTVMVAADIDPAHKKQSWYVEGSDFGAAYLSRVVIRWLNVGKRATSASLLTVAGNAEPAAQFRVCEACGHLDTSSRANSMDEHRPWCPHRKSIDEHTRTIALSRTLATQGVLIALPWNVSTGDLFALPSLQAALLRGLRDTFGGSPDHIGVALVRDPQPGGTNTPALLLHDTVPGGTGYLADLADPDNLWTLLQQVYETVRDCPCRHEDRLACHRCLLPYAPSRDVDRVARQSAERHLRSILGSAEPGPERAWQISTQATQTATHESHLELRFRAAFKSMIESLGSSVQEVPGSWGNTLTFTVGSATWSLRPQVEKASVRPDFMLEGPAGLPSVAIFTDGFNFHATRANNRIADDAAKRVALRAQGDRVIAITSSDLDAADAGTAGPPEWVNSTFLPGLTQLYGFTQGTASAALSGPLAQLGSWVRTASVDDAARFASAVPVLLPHSRDLVVPERASLTEIAQALFEHPDDDPRQGTINAWWWQQGALGVLARRRAGADAVSSSGALIIDVAVVLDDRPVAVDAPGFRRDWETWLRLSNLLTFRPDDHITAITALSSEIAPVSVDVGTARRAHVNEAWRPVVEALLDDPVGVDLANRLAALGIATPDAAGDEVGAQNIPVDLAWEEARVAVLFDPTSDDVRDLEEDGWRVVSPDADLIAEALEAAR